MPNRELAGTVSPQEIITDLGDRRLFEITFAGAFNNQYGVTQHLVEQGLVDPTLAEREPPVETLLGRPLMKNLLKSPEIKEAHDKWYVDLYMGGFKRVFGYKAANRQSELRTIHRDYIPNPLPMPVYVGELPELLSEESTVNALQQRLDLRFGKHGVLAGPPPVVMALYEDIAVSLRPSARTLIQGSSEVWQLETHTYMRGPSEARMAA